MARVLALAVAATVIGGGLTIGFAPTITLLAITATFAMFFMLIKISML